MSKAKGTYHERDLLNRLNGAREFSAFRFPGSGSAPYPLPDILLSTPHVLSKVASSYKGEFSAYLRKRFGIEVKVTSKKQKTISKAQIKELQEFCEQHDATPLLAIKFLKHKKGIWYFIEPSHCRITPSGNYYITLKDCESVGVVFNDFIEHYHA